ncbi:hypothetical protein HK097_005541 [Rhizophlyctis rosea]|uniref:Uncharacterized protein n=1 Tax=Rhizophlyctis rosea TaxID=64517 RepID=A0AAD5SJZ6_9FUNG|nr:hypothetical protein HK097_005541 [Rhizophlyctis rosea]
MKSLSPVVKIRHLMQQPGDRLQFGKAAERAKRELSINVKMVVVGEDCSIPKDNIGAAGRRGLAGVIFVHKVAGHLARSGASLEEVHRTALHVAGNIGTVGVALTPCTIPGASPAFSIEPDEMEIGLGIHGESGTQRLKLLSAREATKQMLDMITSKSADRNYIPLGEKSKVVLLVELSGHYRYHFVDLWFTDFAVSHGLEPVRILSGTLMTSLEMIGASITLLAHNDDSDLSRVVLEGLDSSVQANAWPPVCMWKRDQQEKPALEGDDTTAVRKLYPMETDFGQHLHSILRAVADALIQAEPQLTAYDQVVGDGDCGTSFARGAQAILDELSDDSKDGLYLPLDAIADALTMLSTVVERNMGGTAGAMCCLFLDAAANSLGKAANQEPLLADWADAVEAGADAIKHYGGAAEGDRTMIDALQPLARSLKDSIVGKFNSTEAATRAAQAARQGAAKTAELDKAKAGRTSYLGPSVKGTPDPGAVAIAVIVEAVAGVLNVEA